MKTILTLICSLTLLIGACSKPSTIERKIIAIDSSNFHETPDLSMVPFYDTVYAVMSGDVVLGHDTIRQNFSDEYWAMVHEARESMGSISVKEGKITWSSCK